MSTVMVKICCRRCEGSGWQALEQPYAETFAAVSSAFTGTSEIAKRVGNRYINCTAYNNRLRELERLRLVVSEQRGRNLFWKRT